MPRDIPVGNGEMLVSFDHAYQVRDLYFPHVGQENHVGAGPCRFGVWTTLPESVRRREGERRHHHLYWSDQGWEVDLRYRDDTLATNATLRHENLELELRCCDVVDFHRPVLVRRIEIVNRTDQEREARLVHHQDFSLYGTRVSNTAYYDPQLRSLIHYRKQRYIMASFYLDGEQQIDEYATGTAGFHGAEGTWRDAEDGQLGNNPIAQGAVDSTMMVSVQLPASGMRSVYLVLGCGHRYDDLAELHRFVHREGPQGVIERTTAYWRLWLAAMRVGIPSAPTRDLEAPPSQSAVAAEAAAHPGSSAADQAEQPLLGKKNDQAPEQTTEGPLPRKVTDLFKRSLLVVRTQIDNSGAIIAANDSDIMQFSRDTYSYLWPRDGAFVADALDAAGFPDVSRSFFTFCSGLLTDGGYFLHKYNPDGSPASSWHPWIANGKPQLPIQEDETALVIWALWRHYLRYRDIEFVRPLWIRLIQPAADFLVRYRDPQTHLPLPSYDLWEERWGVHAFTLASVYAGLKAAWQFAVCFGDTSRAAAYATAADQMRDAFVTHMWSAEHDRLLRRIVPLNHGRTAELTADVMAGRTPRRETVARSVERTSQTMDGSTDGKGEGAPLPAGVEGEGTRRPAARPTPTVEFERDPTIDSSMFAIFALELLPVEDARVGKTMAAIQRELTVNSEVGGVARYFDDQYHQVLPTSERVPGNPWFICTLWLTQYHIARASTIEQLTRTLPTLEWVADHARPSGVLAEQLHPRTGEPLSVSPLTWSHATVVSTVSAYISKLERMRVCPTCHQPRPLDPVDSIRLHRSPSELAGGQTLTHSP